MYGWNNVWLEQRVLQLESALSGYVGDSAVRQALDRYMPPDTGIEQSFKAHVIKNSLNRTDNYITLDQGSTAGVKPDMAVVGAAGVVGIVYRTSPSYSLVLPLLNNRCHQRIFICLSARTYGRSRRRHGRLQRRVVLPAQNQTCNRLWQTGFCPYPCPTWPGRTKSIGTRTMSSKFRNKKNDNNLSKQDGLSHWFCCRH